MSDNGYKKWVCIICAWVYDEEAEVWYLESPMPAFQ